VQRDQPRLAELGFQQAENTTVEVDVVESERERL
jgi:hypothetical protein